MRAVLGCWMKANHVILGSIVNKHVTSHKMHTALTLYYTVYKPNISFNPNNKELHYPFALHDAIAFIIYSHSRMFLLVNHNVLNQGSVFSQNQLQPLNKKKAFLSNCLTKHWFPAPAQHTFSHFPYLKGTFSMLKKLSSCRGNNLPWPFKSWKDESDMLCVILVCITRIVHNIHAENRRLLMTLLTTLFCSHLYCFLHTTACMRLLYYCAMLA